MIDSASDDSGTAARRWRDKVLARRRAPGRRRFTPGLAAEYHLRLSAGGYPGDRLDALWRLLGEDGSLLDVGGGTGLWAIPAARRGHRVTVVEPSEAMLSVLREQLRRQPEIGRLITVVAGSWGDVDPGPHAVCLAAHSLYGMADIDGALDVMERLATRAVAVFVRTSRWPGRMADDLTRTLGGHRLQTTNWDDLRAVLETRRTPYSVEMIARERTGHGRGGGRAPAPAFPEALGWLEERLVAFDGHGVGDVTEPSDAWVTWPAPPSPGPR